MHEEESDAIPIPETKPEVGGGVPPAVPDGGPDYEIEDWVIAYDPSIHFSREELRVFLSKDSCYQKLIRQLRKREAPQRPNTKKVMAAKAEAKAAFIRWRALQMEQKPVVPTTASVMSLIKRQAYKVARQRRNWEEQKSMRRILNVLNIKSLIHDRKSVIPRKTSA